VVVQHGSAVPALRAVINELERVRQHGFSERELQAAKADEVGERELREQQRQ